MRLPDHRERLRRRHHRVMDAVAKMILKRLKMDLIERRDDLRFEDVNIVRNIIDEVEEAGGFVSQNSQCKCEIKRKKLSRSDSLLTNTKHTNIVHPGSRSSHHHHQHPRTPNGVRSEGSLYLDFYESAGGLENADANSMRSMPELLQGKSGSRTKRRIKYTSVGTREDEDGSGSVAGESLRHRDSVRKSVKEIPKDDEERAQRRKALTPVIEESLTPDELNSHFAMCQKLFAENKITTKNAWQLRVIDYFLTLASSKRSQDKQSLNMVASTLEICTKVFACRVDDLHTETLRLANSLASHIENKRRREVQDYNEDSDENSLTTKSKKKRNKPRLALKSGAYIAKDVKSLLGPVPQIATVNFNIETVGDPKSTKNLFTLNIPIDRYHEEHLRDKNTPAFLSYAEEDVVDETLIEKKVIPDLKNFKIREEFEGIEMNNEDLANIGQGSSSPCHTEMNCGTTFDDRTVPIFELDGSMHDEFTERPCDDAGDGGDGGDGMAQEVEEPDFGCHRNVQEVRVTSLCPDQEVLSGLFDGTGSASGINGNVILVGPNHWKNKLLKRAAARYTGCADTRSLQKVPKKRSKKTDPNDGFIDFYADCPPIDFNQKVKPVPWVPLDRSKFLLPRNYLRKHRPEDKLLLMNYPRPNYQEVNKTAEEEFNHECQEYNNNNLNDSQYCVERNDDDDGDCDNNELPNDSDNNELPNDCENNKVQNDNNNNESPNDCDSNKAPNTDENTATHDQQQPPFGQTMEENEDVQAEMDANAFDTSLPIIIDPIQVPYAKQAKKVNIKRVKAIMTEILIAKGVLSASANSRPEGISRENFMQVYLELLEHLPEQMLKEMSVPIAYFALLQLTNDRGLLLQNSPNFKDVVVSNEVLNSHLLMDD